MKNIIKIEKQIPNNKTNYIQMQGCCILKSLNEILLNKKVDISTIESLTASFGVTNINNQDVLNNSILIAKKIIEDKHLKFEGENNE